ncbi:protein phosphatase CheZ [Rhodanobacter sp. AS-Z3]|uniref:protein phosphatase CheZ n=1 Tax=Rhodanobacter sp. AS-Z3 TaxID=3031330 RepID=UPI00247ABD09|nr:protein phosphatase CheZ [Rhodanobacter sp. AS-Z3]WEN14592.1 protein phosphatase CheZ [Rhodanobacter sp. AS-Z3]
MSTTNDTAISEDLPVELRDLLNSPEGPAFEHALDVMVRQREQHMFRALGQLARDLHDAVRRLGGDLAQEGFPGNVANARLYLQEALELSSKAAHGTIDFAERISPQADSLIGNAVTLLEKSPDAAATALARESTTFAANCRDGLADMVVAQSWQDLTGQRIKKVDGFIGTVESTLLELVRLTGALAGSEMPASVAKISSQEEADRLLSEFGF